MAPTVIMKRIYNQEFIASEFQYFVTSRSLYNRLRLQSITVDKYTDKKIVKSILAFSTL